MVGGEGWRTQSAEAKLPAKEGRVGRLLVSGANLDGSFIFQVAAAQPLGLCSRSHASFFCKLTLPLLLLPLTLCLLYTLPLVTW